MKRLIVFFLIMNFAAATAQYYRSISYQGYLSDTSGNPKPDGSYLFNFKLYKTSDAAGWLWNEVKSIKTRQGLFSTYLGDANPLPASVGDGKELWLGVQVEGDPEMNPRVPFSSVFNSFHSGRSDTAAVALSVYPGMQWQADGDNVYRAAGNVGIGTSDTKGYRLAVSGGIVAEEVVVKLQTDWPDYVFGSDYKLRSLKDLQGFIIVNRHLPGVPSSENINKNGLLLARSQAMLLQKIEELTLYILKLNEKIEGLENQIKKSK